MVVEKVNLSILNEQLRSKEFRSTLNIIEEIQEQDNNKPEAFPLLYQFKKEDIGATVNMEKEEVVYYKSGKNDPSKL